MDLVFQYYNIPNDVQSVIINWIAYSYAQDVKTKMREIHNSLWLLRYICKITNTLKEKDHFGCIVAKFVPRKVDERWSRTTCWRITYAHLSLSLKCRCILCFES
jgi:hypothetical protein